LSKNTTMSRADGQGWRASDLASLSFSRIPYVADRSSLTAALVQRLDDGPGFAIITGVPLDGLSLDEACDVAPELLSELGEPFLQGPRETQTRPLGNSHQARGTAWLVDQSGDHLDIHNEGAMLPYGNETDLIALLCVESALKAAKQFLSVLVPSLMSCTVSIRST
jgi:hypothetical protein